MITLCLAALFECLHHAFVVSGLPCAPKPLQFLRESSAASHLPPLLGGVIEGLSWNLLPLRDAEVRVQCPLLHIGALNPLLSHWSPSCRPGPARVARRDREIDSQPGIGHRV